MSKAAAVPKGYKQTEVGVIPEDWGVVCLADGCSKIQDGTHFSPRPGGNEYLYVTSKNIRFGFLDVSSAPRIDAAQHAAIYKRCDVRKGDLLLTKDGANTGNAAINLTFRTIKRYFLNIQKNSPKNQSCFFKLPPALLEVVVH